MSTDTSIRRVTIAEHAEMAAARAIETCEPQINPHPEGSPEHRCWSVAYHRALQVLACPECDGGA